MSANITIQWNYPRGRQLLPYDDAEIKQLLSVMIKQLIAYQSLYLCEIELNVLDDASISVAQYEFMKCIGPTNILSFPGSGEMPGILLLSADTFMRECFLYGQSREDYFQRLLAHGMCHLAGYEHGEKMDSLAAQLRTTAAASLSQRQRSQ